MKKFIIVWCALSLSGCTIQGTLASFSSDATEQDITNAIHECPEIKEEILECLTYQTNAITKIEGRCTKPLSKKSLEYLIEDCKGKAPSEKEIVIKKQIEHTLSIKTEK